MRAAELVFALAFLAAGIGAAVLFWSGDRAHFRVLAPTLLRDTRIYTSRDIGVIHAIEADDATRRYVLCECDDATLLERVYGFYNPREKAHLRDVQQVLTGTKRVTLLGSLVMLAGLWLDPRRLRSIVLLEAGGLAGFGAIVALAFQPAFLLFHQVLFPQGNFLFDPATDNLVLLYPETYWLLVTLLVGVTFVLMALAVAALASVRIRFGSQTARGRAVGRS